jgi:hypothetical protein
MPHNFKGTSVTASGLRKICAKTIGWDLLQRANHDEHLLKHVITGDWDVSLCLWSWNQTTILTLEKSCFASPQESMTGALVSESNAVCFFFSIIEALCVMTLLLKVGQLIEIFMWRFWDVCGMQYEESNLKCGLREAGSSITIMHLPIHHCQLDNSWQNIQSLPFHNHPYSHDLSRPDFFLYPKLKITHKGRFHTVEYIIANVTNDILGTVLLKVERRR